MNYFAAGQRGFAKIMNYFAGLMKTFGRDVVASQPMTAGFRFVNVFTIYF
jgi:hypothetical protein